MQRDPDVHQARKGKQWYFAGSRRLRSGAACGHQFANQCRGTAPRAPCPAFTSRRMGKALAFTWSTRAPDRAAASSAAFRPLLSSRQCQGP